MSPLTMTESLSPDYANANNLSNPETESKFLGYLDGLVRKNSGQHVYSFCMNSRTPHLDYVNSIDGGHETQIVPSGRLREGISITIDGENKPEKRKILFAYAASLAHIGLRIYIEKYRDKLNQMTCRLYVRSIDPEDEMYIQMLEIEIQEDFHDNGRDDLDCYTIQHLYSENFRMPIRELFSHNTADTKSLELHQKLAKILDSDKVEKIAQRYRELVQNGMHARWIPENDAFTRPMVYEDFFMIDEEGLLQILTTINREFPQE